MDQIIELEGLDEELFRRVGPLVMNPVVLKQNHNFPFRTTENFRWYLALAAEHVIGFVPVERRKRVWTVNNYYIAGRDFSVLSELLLRVTDAAASEGMPLEAVAFLEDVDVYRELGFEEEKRWTRYVKMVRNKREDHGEESEERV